MGYLSPGSRSEQRVGGYLLRCRRFVAIFAKLPFLRGWSFPVPPEVVATLGSRRWDAPTTMRGRVWLVRSVVRPALSFP
jgi:hypothetical protein